jgi:hypothetical protein
MMLQYCTPHASCFCMPAHPLPAPLFKVCLPMPGVWQLPLSSFTLSHSALPCHFLFSRIVHCGRSTLRPSRVGAAALLKFWKMPLARLLVILLSHSARSTLTVSHSSQALPAPKPRPTHAGHALLLNRRTEKTMPKERPREERMAIEERQRSHCEGYVSIIVV